MISSSLRSTLVTGALAWAAFGCRSLERFDTDGPAAYCGSLVSGPAFNAGLLPAGVTPDVRIALEINPSQLATTPGELTVDHTDPEHFSLCRDEPQPLFDAAPLRAIPEVSHDTLSELNFGEGHDDNFFAWADSTCQGTMLTLVSLLRGGDVELRLFKPASRPRASTPPDKVPGYALFYLRRNDDGCSF